MCIIINETIKFNQMKKFSKYKKNLSIIRWYGAYWIQSDTIRVARIDYENKTVIRQSRCSMTTLKHINYVCNQLNLTQIIN